jgi:UDP-perosamine 4-acetyltransferase
MSCLDACDDGSLRPVGYIAPQPDNRLPLDHLGGDEALHELRGAGVELAFVAVGDNARRAALGSAVQALGFQLATIIASTAHVSPYASVGAGAAVLHGAHVGPRSRVGTGAIINTAASIDHDCTIGDYAHLAPGTHLAGGVGVGSGVFAGVGVSVIPDVEVGEWAVLGAGAVVINDIPPATTVVGAPARARRRS